MLDAVVDVHAQFLNVPAVVLDVVDGPTLASYRRACRAADSGMKCLDRWSAITAEYDKQWAKADAVADELPDELRAAFTQQYPLSAAWPAGRVNPGFAGGLPWVPSH